MTLEELIIRDKIKQDAARYNISEYMVKKAYYSSIEDGKLNGAKYAANIEAAKAKTQKRNKKLSTWIAKGAREKKLDRETIKNAYFASIIDGKLNRDMLQANIDKARQNAEKRKKTSDYIYCANNIIKELHQNRINIYAVPEFTLSSDAKYTHVIANSKDYYGETIKIIPQCLEYIKFTGLSSSDLMLYSALYTALKQGIFQDGKDTVSGDVIKLVDIQQVYTIINPCKRWDRLSFQAQKDFISKIDALARHNKFEFKYLCNKLRKNWSCEVFRGLMNVRLVGLSKQNFIDKDFSRVKIQIKQDAENLFSAAEAQKRIISIPSKMLKYGTNTANHGLIKFYIAYRLNIKSKKMIKSITIDTLEKYCGKTDKKFVKKYMQYLADIGFIADYEVGRHAITWETEADSKSPLIVMHDDNGAISKNPPAMTGDVKQREKDLKKINAYLAKQEVRLNGKKIDTALHAVYCGNDWHKGGRIYTGKNGFQNLSKEERANLTINGANVIELDFSAYHPNILYAYENKQLEDDPYSFWGDRQAAKKALNIVLNAKDRAAAIGAVKHAVSPGTDVSSLLQSMEAAHKSISKYFFSGAGTGLQNIDSEIAIQILLSLQKQGIPALPVHDSFIVRKKDASALRGVMYSAYKQYTGNYFCEVK